jgi:dTDP-glucose 4,6-dehydratase
MRHFIIGGDGFVGRQLAADLLAAGEAVVVADIAQDHLKPLPNLAFVPIDIRRRETLDALDFGPEDAVYNMAAKMLSPIQIRRNRHEFFWPVNFHGVENLLDRMEKAGARRLVQFPTSTATPTTFRSPKAPVKSR